MKDSFETEVATLSVPRVDRPPDGSFRSLKRNLKSPNFMGLGITSPSSSPSRGILANRRESTERCQTPRVEKTSRRGSKSVNIISPKDSAESIARRKSFTASGPQPHFLGLTHFDGALRDMKKSLEEENSDLSDERDYLQDTVLTNVIPIRPEGLSH